VTLHWFYSGKDFKDSEKLNIGIGEGTLVVAEFWMQDDMVVCNVVVTNKSRRNLFQLQQLERIFPVDGVSSRRDVVNS
jgi:hypothetical protein